VLSELVAHPTGEQLEAIERRSGDLLVDAGAGSGKTSVLVERFVRTVLEDGVAVGAILTITFTDKAAAELRDRIRARLRELGALSEARDTERAFISTIHGFCARALRTHALSAGIDPGFKVLDEQDSERLAGAAFEAALEALAREPGGVELIASYGPGALRGAIIGTYGELRSRGEREPSLPPLGPPPALEPLRAEVLAAAQRVAGELGALSDPGARVVLALERLGRCEELLAGEDPWPGALEALALPGGNGAALSTPACVQYSDALARLRGALEHGRAGGIHALLNRLLADFGARYGALKREASGLDFEDLELECLELLRAQPELRERYARRFEAIMVDELQDTNAVQLELIELIGRGNLFTVGDAQQSIYGFRHADVELFEQRGARLAQMGARLTLRRNFRSRPEILEVLGRAFASAIGERFVALEPGREPAGAPEPLVELLVADKGADYAAEGIASPWRVAEARALAARVEELVMGGARAGQIVVLTRASTDLRAYERALEDRGIPTYVIGGRGYWAHPQVVDLVAYLRALANPRDEEALYTVLACPLVGVSLDALVLLAARARSEERDPWWVLQSGVELDVADLDRERLADFTTWFAREREGAARASLAELIERVLEQTDYDLAMLAMPGGERRLANVRKLMRLAREHEAANGAQLRGFLELIQARARGLGGRALRENEAPVEGEGLDAVRLMTIHRAKGLEFEIVCVADLGRGPRWGGELLRIGRDGRLGLRLSEPGTGRALPALDWVALGDEQRVLEEAEERRIYYVAMTRARERLVLSGAARVESLDREGSAMGWILPAFREAGLSEVVVEADVGERAVTVRTPARPGGGLDPARRPEPPGTTVSQLSYSSLSELERCGYRFYMERVLGLPAIEERGAGGGAGAGLSAIDRGILVHALLEKLDFRRPVAPGAEAVIEAAAFALGESEASEVAALVRGFADSELCRRLGEASSVRREERFSFVCGEGPLITGAFDVLARERGGRMLVVDYKSDRLEGADPAAAVESAGYALQRMVYALAVLRAGAPEVEVVHVFLERPHEPVSARFAASDAGELEDRLRTLTERVRARRFEVAEVPHRALCAGCPAEGGLCSWPLALTRRDAPDRLF